MRLFTSQLTYNQTKDNIEKISFKYETFIICICSIKRNQIAPAEKSIEILKAYKIP